MICGYHTCKNRHGYNSIVKNIPFLSKEFDQWVDQGYYFWLDSLHWAHEWGTGMVKASKCKGYVVGKFNINIEKENCFDIAWNKEHNDLFASAIDKMLEKAGEGTEPEIKVEDITVPVVLEYLKELIFEENEETGENNKLPFQAVITCDNKGRHKAFYPNTKYNEHLVADRRTQICVFEEYRDLIELAEITYPEEYKALYLSKRKEV